MRGASSAAFSGRQRPCDYCGAAAAALHCRADAARLCLACDCHVHAANALSRRHVRAPLCEACANRSAVKRIVSGCEPRFLCGDCNGGCAAAAARVPVEGFSGCPVASELAASWGFDLLGGRGGVGGDDPFLSELDYSTMLSVNHVLLDLYVPCDPLEVAAGASVGRRLKGERLCHQLVEMARREVETVPPPSPHLDLSPRTAGRSSPAASGRFPENEAAPAPPAQETPSSCTSLMMMAPARRAELVDDDELVWESAGPPNPAAQIWDFNLGRSRNHNENYALQVQFGLDNGGSVIKSYNDMLQKISAGTTKDLEDNYDSRYSAAAEDIMSTNICQSTSKNLSNVTLSSDKQKVYSCASTTEGSTTSVNHLSAARPLGSSPDSGAALAKEISFGDKTILASEAERPTKSANSQMFMQNRDSAMQRYREKRKTRRKLRADTRKRVKGRFIKSADIVSVGDGY